jgi:hypothetical protein
MSILKVNTLEEATAGGATFFTAKAWVNFNGIGTVAIRDDGNVSTITDNGTGDYTINFSASLAGADYTISGMAQRDTTNELLMTDIPANSRGYTPLKTGSVRLFSRFSSSFSLVDPYTFCMGVIR